MPDLHNADLRNEIAALLNIYNRENASDTPDFILAEYLMGCLAAFETAVQVREQWYGRRPERPEQGEE